MGLGLGLGFGWRRSTPSRCHRTCRRAVRTPSPAAARPSPPPPRRRPATTPQSNPTGHPWQDPALSIWAAARGGKRGRAQALSRRRCRCRRAGGGRARARPSKAHRGGKWGHRSSHGKWSGSHARVARAHLHRLEVRRAARVAPPPRAPRRLLSGAAHTASVSSAGSSLRSAASGRLVLALAHTAIQALAARESTRHGRRLGRGGACHATGGSRRNAPPPTAPP